jgi:hypothetical protein
MNPVTSQVGVTLSPSTGGFIMNTEVSLITVQQIPMATPAGREEYRVPGVVASRTKLGGHGLAAALRGLAKRCPGVLVSPKDPSECESELFYISWPERFLELVETEALFGLKDWEEALATLARGEEETLGLTWWFVIDQ